MKVSYCKTKFAALAAILFMLGGVTSYAETLGDVLKESKWDGIIGTWVDPKTKGQNRKVTYAWKVKDHAILVTGTAFGTNSVAIMGRNAKDGTVFHAGTDSKGTSVLGEMGSQGRRGHPWPGVRYERGSGRSHAGTLYHEGRKYRGGQRRGPRSRTHRLHLSQGEDRYKSSRE